MRALLGFVLGVFVLLVPGVWLAMAYPSFTSGDLTRIARLPGADLRARVVQPSLRPSASISPDQADVLVLGDSFSVGNLWQTRFEEKTGLEVATWRIREEGCVAGWLEQALAGGLSAKAKTIVIETVERVFVQRMVSPNQPCASQIFKPEHIDREVALGEAVLAPLFPIDVRYVVRTAINSRKPEYSFGRFELRKAVVVDLDRADLFSSRLSSRLLYLRHDELPAERWSEEMVKAALMRFKGLQDQAKANGMRLLLVTVPDKSTVYSPWVSEGQWPQQPDGNLFKLIEQSLGAPQNLLPDFQLAAEQIIDFYRPDDTHLSLNGFRFLGERIAQLVSAAKD